MKPSQNNPKDMRVTLLTARKLKMLTQEEAAKKLGLNKGTLGNYERGESYPTIPVLRKIEEIYGVRYEQIIFLPLDYGLTGQSDDLTE